MSNILETAEAAAAPWLIWVKIGAAALAIAAIAYGGWYAHAIFDGTAIAQAQTSVAKCAAANATDAANTNGASAAAQATSSAAATASDDSTAKTAAARAHAYDALTTTPETADAKPVLTPVDLGPLLNLFNGLHDADAAAAGAGADRDGLPETVAHDLPGG